MTRPINEKILETPFLAKGRSREKTDLFMVEHARRRKALVDYRGELGLTGSGALFMGPLIVGFPVDPDSEVPAGWRRDKKNPNCVVPSGTSKAARAGRDRLEGLSDIDSCVLKRHGEFCAFDEAACAAGFLVYDGRSAYDRVSFHTIAAGGGDYHHILLVRHLEGEEPIVPLDAVRLKQSELWALKEAAE